MGPPFSSMMRSFSVFFAFSRSWLQVIIQIKNLVYFTHQLKGVETHSVHHEAR